MPPGSPSEKQEGELLPRVPKTAPGNPTLKGWGYGSCRPEGSTTKTQAKERAMQYRVYTGDFPVRGGWFSEGEVRSELF
jgi:hypothetical protein